MAQKIHLFSLEYTNQLINQISKIERFDSSWSYLEKREGQLLTQIKQTIKLRSVGASMRIDGSKMTDAEVELIIKKLNISNLEEKDEQEAAGYFEALNTITESYKDLEISEDNLKNLHKILMRHCEKDEPHRGGYKQESNAEEEIKKLFEWYHSDNDTLSIVKTSLFIYGFLDICPFHEGNERLSRLLTTLLLLKNDYSWIQYVSFEQEIENRKTEYYEVLRQTQQQRLGEEANEWVVFFLSCILNIHNQLINKLAEQTNSNKQLSPKEKNILVFIESHPGSKSGEIAHRLNEPLSTIKKILTKMTEKKLILKQGIGAGTYYTIE